MRRNRQLLWYTGGFLIASVLAFWPLVACGKSLINAVDGLPQQYGTFVDTGKTIRSVVRGLLAGEGLHIPMYDLSMGYGNPRSWPCDPFMYLSAFCPTAATEALFNVIVLAKLWLCGVAVLPLVRELEVSEWWGIAAALAYAFSGEGLNCMLQTHYLNTMILFPLVVLGAVRIIRGGSVCLYALASGVLGLIAGWYGLYIADLQIAVLVAVVLFYRRSSPLTWLGMFARFLVAIVISLAISAIRIPSVLGVASLDRISVRYSNPTLYSWSYYQRLLSGFTGVMFGERDWFFGFGAIGLLCTVLLWTALERDRIVQVLRALLLVATLFVCVPFFGSLFNGTSYVTNRWVYGYSLLIACVVGVVGTRRKALGKKDALVTAAILFSYCAAVIILPDAVGIESRWQMLVAWAMLVVMVVHDRFALGGRGIAMWLLAALVLVGLGINYAMFISPYGTNWQERLVPWGTAYDRLAAKTPAALASEVAGEELVRADRSVSLYQDVGTYGLLAHRVLDTYGIDFYSSQYNNRVDRFHRDLALAESDLPNAYVSLDQRFALQRLMGVGLYVASNDDGMGLPYGFAQECTSSLVGENEITYDIYKSLDAAQIVHVMDGSMSETTYKALSSLDKQEALLRTVVLSDEEAVATEQFELPSREVSFEVGQLDEGLELGDGFLDVMTPGSSITLELQECPRMAELYLAVDALALQSVEEPECFYVKVASEYAEGTDAIFTPYSHLYGGKDSWLWNLGYHEKGTVAITLTFWNAGRYSYASFRVLAQPVRSLERSVDAWGEVEGLSWDKNACSLKCAADATEGQLLFLAIPYDEGWHARIDGQDADILLADTAFMALRLPEGYHEIELSYESTSWVLVLVGLVATLLCIVLRRKRSIAGRGERLRVVA